MRLHIFSYRLAANYCCCWSELGGKKGSEWDHAIIVEQKKENLQVQCKCCVVQILSSSEMCDKFGLQAKETSWPDADYRSYFIYKTFNMLLLLQGKSGTELKALAILTDACCKDRRTLESPLDFWPNSRTFQIRQEVKVREKELLAEPQTAQPW